MSEILAALIELRHAQFVALADSWLAAGATSFSIYEENRELARWVHADNGCAEEVHAPIMIGKTILGELRVSGLCRETAEARLKAEAGLIAHMGQLEEELQMMTGELVQQQDQILSLYKLTHSMRSQASIEATLRYLILEAMRMVRAQGGFAVLVPASAEPVLVQYPLHEPDEATIWRCFWQCHARGRELVSSSTPGPEGITLPPGFTNLLFIPIEAPNTIAAGLGLINKPGATFNAPDIKLMRAIAEQATAQIEKVLLHQETFLQARLKTEMELARRVQAGLMPQYVPQVNGIDIAAGARSAFQVGGDFYDFVYHTDRPFFFAVGDVTGKGLSAGLLMTMTRTAIHSKASFLPNPTPQKIMQQSNEDLYNDFTQVGVFATAFVGQYLPHEQRLVYANAGHSPVIYRPYNERARLLKASGMAIGIMAESFCIDEEVRLAPGDLLVVATDGFNETAHPHDGIFGYDRMLSLVDSLADEPAQKVVDALFDTVEQFRSGNAQEDDQTLVVLKGLEQ